MLFIPVFQETHFYVIHRLIHWPPLYRAVHSLHHENVNPGPWSGVAMHPVEHVLYFSGVFLHWILPSHPLHVLFHLQYTALSPTQGHCGFHKIELPGKIAICTEQYAHYLHHKYFEVNYGGDIVPFDKLFGTFHDGSDEAQEALNRRMRIRNRAPRN
jgi:sterol desaturase/sphingolipid hydroxylase (fatty acid hydroxylase superfamily)